MKPPPPRSPSPCTCSADTPKSSNGPARRWTPYSATAAEHYPALTHLTRILKEAMRLFPALPVVPRRSVAGCVVDGMRIPAGADVLVSPYVTHRHPGHWQDPERFDPDRFTPEREAARHRYAWLPFGGGPRSCIGQHFSMLESVLGLATTTRFRCVSSAPCSRVGPSGSNSPPGNTPRSL